MQRTTLVRIIVFVVFAVTVVTWFQFSNKPKEVFCTQEAKLCPDGSAVGRTGPECEFAECPKNTPPIYEDESVIRRAQIGKSVSALGVTITPQEVLEDSRCPAVALCVWEGRVRLRVMLKSGLGEAQQIFVLKEPITTEAEEIVFTAVEPPAPSAGVVIAPQDYRFTFTIKKRGSLDFFDRYVD